MRRLRVWYFVLAGLGFLAGYGGEAIASPPSPGFEPRVTPFSDGLQIEWESPEPVIIQGEGGDVHVQMPGFGNTGQPGVPDVPVDRVLIALPPGAEPTLETYALNESRMSLSGPLATNPEPRGVNRDPQGNVTGGAYAPASQEVPFDPAPLEIEDLGMVRGVRLARLVFHPVIPEGEGIRLVSRVAARLRFNAPSRISPEMNALPDPLVEALKGLVINPAQVTPESRQLSAGAAAPSSGEAISQVAMIQVSEPGITQITYSALFGGGFPVWAVNPQNLRLTHEGTEVAIEWVGDGDSSFESWEGFYFYADPRVSRWTDHDYYQLSEGTSPGLRMGSRSASPSGISTYGNATAEFMVEENLTYTPDCACGTTPLGWDGDRWAWQKLSRPNNATADFSFSLASVNTTQPGTVTVWLIGYTDVFQNPDHRVSTSLNTVPLTPATIEWNGKQTVVSDLSVPAGAYAAGNNQFTLTLPGISGISVEGMWLDAFRVSYVLGTASAGNSVRFTGEATQRKYQITLNNLSGLRAYDITTPTRPLRLSGYTTASNTVTLGDPSGGGTYGYIVTNSNGIRNPVAIRLKQSLTSQGGGFLGADYLILTHQDFASALTSLVNLREGQGLDVLVEDVQAVFDNFDEGRPTPDAIRAFLQEAYDSWLPRPTYVLLVGDGTADPKRYYDNSFYTYIPPYLAAVDPWMGETAADNRYVTLDGGDVMPDMLIGRLPANNLTEAQTMVAKIVGYETSPPPGAWTDSVVFVADNEDPAGDFPEDAEYLANTYIPGDYAIERIYHADGTPPSETHTAVMDSWNAGNGLMTYIGHGSHHTWTGESILHISDLIDLANGDELPVVVALTCYTGSFHTPGLDALDEEMVREPGGGAVASWGPTGLGLASGHVELADGFLESIFFERQPGLGLAIFGGKMNVATSAPTHADLIDTYTLFGDPAQIVLFAPPRQIYLPLVTR